MTARLHRLALPGWWLLATLVAVTGLLTALVQGGWSPLRRWDTSTTRGAESWAWSVEPAKLLTHLGDPVGVSLGSVLVAIALWSRGHALLAALMVVSRIGASVLSSGLKAATDRARPVFEEPVATAGSSAFPSGHALGATAFWLTAAVVAVALGRSRWWLLPALGVAVLVAATRVLIGVHWLSDAVAGVLLGLAWVMLCVRLIAARAARREEAS